jgi:hypothetical protein
MEACAAGCMPLLPDRLSYPELVPEKYHAQCIYADQADLVRRLSRLCAEPGHARQGVYQWREIAAAFDLPGQAALMDQELIRIAGGA